MSKRHWPTTLALVLAAIALPAGAQSLSSTNVRAVPTYEAAGLYWSAPGAGGAGCDVRYRRQGDSAWSDGLALWYDAASNECRGSLVNLAPGTAYEAQLGVNGAMQRAIAFTTWSNAKPEATTVRVASGQSTYNITQGGSASGYVVYDGSGSTLDGRNAVPYNITINASYVIVRGFALTGAQQHAILISPDVHDVVIEGNDITNWGRTRDGTWGTDMDSGIRAICSSPTLERVTIQKNRIHDPRYSANSWSVGHPAGPQGITFSYCGGNHVIRWNEITSPGGHYFNDPMGGEDNFSTGGFPNADSDIYGNVIGDSWDDGIEAEGANRNVRIWGNYIDRTATGIATTVTSVGPVYIFRNVWNRNQFYSAQATDADDRQPFFKSGSSSSFANGRRYLFHNTMLQAAGGSLYPLGGGAGIGGTGNTQLVHNTVSMNNIYHLWKPNSAVYQVGTDNTFERDLFNGRFDAAITSGINATPSYLPGHGASNGPGGYYQLAAGSPGHDQGVRIPNFNDAFVGAGPDVGAAESGAGPMVFGPAAAQSGGSVVIPSTPSAPTPPATPPTPSTPTGATSSSLGISSSSYTVAAGQPVTFTVSLSGAQGAPTGTIEFRANGTAIAGCAPVTISSGRAQCSTAALASGAHSITGYYGGSSVYTIGQAGPITQTVTGATSSMPSTPSTPSTPSVPAASGTFNVQSLWWGSAAESGWGLNVAHQGDVVFATWFTYDLSGKGQWLVMSDGRRTGTNTYSGTLYRTTGPAFSAATFDPSRVTTTAVGTATLAFSDPNQGTFIANVGGTTVTKAITRQAFSSPMPTCTQASTTAGANYQDLWWNPGGRESGWGMNIAQQGDVMFVTWFTYDTDGSPMWLVASNVKRLQGETFAGDLYRTTGPVFDTAAWNAAAVSVVPVGSVRLAFSDASNGTFSYTVGGVSQSKAITRQLFASPATVCR